MASSTTIPMAILRDESEMIFNVFPEISKYINAATNDTGITIATMSVARQRPRKNNTMSTTRISVTIMVWIRLSITRLILSEESITIPIVISEGRFFSSSGKFSVIFLQICTVLDPACFWIITVPPWTPSI
ncbi:MAG: hypothetical protein BWX93_01981 [Bacteroidetes bacterium ADurb.Bin139]|nr:MAG: hypothetical protein BWX93_01981 [Bacteroidetes bacterium ADurb.Bin139]